MQTGFTSLTAANIQDSLGNKLAKGTLEVLPTNTKDQPIPASCNGLLIERAAPITITNGALPAGQQVPISAACSPVNLCFRLTVKDASGATLLKIPLVQTTSGGLNLDTLSIPYATPLSLIQKGDKGDKGDTGSPGSFGPVVKTASQLGCVMNGVTDDAATINAFLAGATTSSPRVLLIDGLAAVSNVIIPTTGCCSIIGFGDTTGFALLNGSNKPVISCGPWADLFGPQMTPTPPRTAANILLRDFYVFGNRAGQNQTYAGGTSLGYVMGIDLWNCVGIRIENVTLDHAAKYSIQISNCSVVNISGCRCAPFSPGETVVATNTDGIHVDGPSSNITIADCYFRTGDDSIALNCPEGYGGEITNVMISNCVINGSQTGVRLYTDTSDTKNGYLHGITVIGLTGSVNVAAFIVGVELAHTSAHFDMIYDIGISNVNISGPRFMLISDSIGSMSISDCTWAEALSPAGFVQAWSNNQTWSNLTIRNIRMLRNSVGNGQNCVIDTVTMTSSGQTVNILQLTISDVSMNDMGAGTTPHDYAGIPLLNLKSGTFISQLTFSGLSLRIGSLLWLSGAPAAPSVYSTYISTIASTDFLRMFNPIPDSVAYVGTLYVSSDHGNALSVNLNGERSTITTVAH